MIVEIVLVLSIILNIFLLFYGIRIARRMFVVGTNLETLYGLIDSFSVHVRAVHESEMFYGDQTLQALIQHSKDLVEELENYEDLFYLVDVEEEGEDEEENQ